MLAIHRSCFSSLLLPVTPSHACAQALHNAGLVHRDVKPLNLILSEEERRFKLIDLGAAADLRNGTNYAPGARSPLLVCLDTLSRPCAEHCLRVQCL